MNRLCLVILLVLLVSLPAVVGCDEKPKVQASSMAAGGVKPSPIRMLDHADRKVTVVRHVTRRIDGDLLQLRTQFRSRDKNGTWIDIQVAWKDADGFELYRTPWAALHVSAGVVTDHDIASMRSDVDTYEFRIRPQGQ
ncbi:MAG: hypothetical protein GVY16_05895 [Planctomycetes bacterium]|nr:hypothetical protein [Planctomycetota bacterium]